MKTSSLFINSVAPDPNEPRSVGIGKEATWATVERIAPEESCSSPSPSMEPSQPSGKSTETPDLVILLTEGLPQSIRCPTQQIRLLRLGESRVLPPPTVGLRQ